MMKLAGVDVNSKVLFRLTKIFTDLFVICNLQNNLSSFFHYFLLHVAKLQRIL